MATIRERRKADGTAVFHVQVRVAGYPARTASFRSRALAKKWATTVEAEMIEGRHFRSVEARRRTVGEAIDRYIKDELPKKRDAVGPRSRLQWWKTAIGSTKLAELSPALIVEHRDKLARSTYASAVPGLKCVSRHGMQGANLTIDVSSASSSPQAQSPIRAWRGAIRSPMGILAGIRQGRAAVP